MNQAPAVIRSDYVNNISQKGRWPLLIPQNPNSPTTALSIAYLWNFLNMHYSYGL